MKQTVLVLLALVSTLFAAAFADNVLPSSPKGQLVRQYLNAFNSGEPAMRAFLERTPSATAMDERIARYRAMKSDIGNFTPVRLVAGNGDSLEVIVRTADGRELSLNFKFAGEPPHIAGMRIERADADSTPSAGGPPADERTVLHQIQSQLEEKAKAGEFSGTILVARGSEAIWQGAFGEANQAEHIPNQIDTRFDVGSIAKSFTAVAIGQLSEKGKLKLTDKVGVYLPNYPNPAVREQVTIDQLLQMSSGIGDFFGEKFQKAPKDKIRTLADYLPFFATEPLQFPPGSNRKYSNGGYLVLGLIIEAVSGESYYDYVKKNIFERAGMKDTAFGFRDGADTKQAIGYTTMSDSGRESPGSPRHPNLAVMPARGSSAGSAQSTATDLFSFSQALAAGKLVSGDTLAKLDIHPDGMGIAGGAPGVNAALDSGVPGAGSASYTVVVLSNFDPPSAEKASKEVRSLLRRAK
ncbi:MAG TPA: serine hydrolase domain-containing protein [Terriglobales bacterium]|nr:serine hydrolase domain-containing protein [Terriglobales bacterium]